MPGWITAGSAGVMSAGGAESTLPAPPARQRLHYLRDVLTPRPQERDECEHGQREDNQAPRQYHEYGHDGPPYQLPWAACARRTATEDHE
jgi:hypothetical protein